MINKNQYMKKPVFSGHESFACKSHWLKRGYDFVLAGHSFNNEDGIVLTMKMLLCTLELVRIWSIPLSIGCEHLGY